MNFLTNELKPLDIWQALGVMGKGMLAIFAVAAIIILTVVVLNKVTSKKK
ncbi:MAG: hypothetical protein IJF42_06790 [Clostridia bacterium]|nr:hypothetical protein [Clostridia bacterium]MBQ7302933.1 hypothetical protein [Clostridia bacterium]